jgi:hypothetical protein
VKNSLSLFLAGTLVFWVVVSGLAMLLWPEQRESSLIYSAAAAGLCLVPSTLTLLWALVAPGQSPEQRRLVILGGTGIRLFFVLGAGLLLTSTVGYFHRQSFWLWLALFYLVTLALEMVLVVRTLASDDKHSERGADASRSGSGSLGKELE